MDKNRQKFDNFEKILLNFPLNPNKTEKGRGRTVMSINVRSPPRVDMIPWFQALSSYSASTVSNFNSTNFPIMLFQTTTKAE